jgi:putative PEP-CTERM system TPR-repeat lipoprotein
MVSRAEQAMADRDYRSAMVDLKSVLRKNPDDARARWLLAELYLDLGDGASAQKELEWAKRLGVNEDAVVPAFAHALYMQDKFQELLGLQPEGALSQVAAAELEAFRALAHLSGNAIDRAKSSLDAAERHAPTAVRVRYARARILLAQHDIDAALHEVQQLTADVPDFAEGWALLGKLLAGRKDNEAAESAYSRAIALSVSPVNELSQRGVIRAALGKWESAMQDANALRKAVPKHYFGHYLAAAIHYEQGQLGEAQEALERAVELAPQDFASVFLLAYVDTQLGNPERGRQFAERAVAIGPRFIPARKLLALLHLRDRKGAEAESLLRPVVTARPDDYQAKNLLAAALMQQAQVAEAAELLEQVADANPESAEAQLQAGVSALSAGDAARGLIALGRAAELAPDSPEIRSALVGGYLRQQAAEEALRAAQRFVEQNPRSIEGLNMLAATQVAASADVDARSTFGAVLALEPGNPVANRALALLALRDKDSAAANRYLDAALAEHPEDLRLLLLKARTAQIAAEFSQLDEYLERAIEAHPDVPLPRVLRAERWLEQGDPEKALFLLGDLADSRDWGVLSLRGEAYFQLGRLADAKADWESLAQLRPNEVQVQSQLARVYAGLRDHARLAQTVDRILSLAPADKRARVAKARLLLVENKLEEATSILDSESLDADSPDVLAARVDLARLRGDSDVEITLGTQLLALEPTPQRAIELGRAFRRAGREEEADTLLANWLAEHPGDIAVRLELSNVSVASGDYEAAISYLLRVVELEPANLFALNNLAWFLRESDPSKALGFAQRAYEEAPGALAVGDTYAAVLASNGEFAQALRVIGGVIDRAPDSARYRLHRAEIHRAAGDREAALTEVRSLLAGDVSGETQRQAEELLRVLGG